MENYMVLFMIACGLHCVRTESSTHDFRIISYSELQSDRSVHVYESKGIEDYSQLVIDSKNDQLIVGARDHLLRLSSKNLDELEAVSWKPNNISVMTCLARGQTKENCRNFVRVLVLHNDRIFTCGTNAFTPNCTWRDVKQLKDVQESLTGIAKCPYHPEHNTTALMTASGDLYSATVTDYTGRDPAILRMMGPSPYLRTVQYNSRWLNEPNFVSTYEINESVYFFFRETAVEYINCGKSVYSRVARLCKSDTGGKFVLEDNWTSFSKARLNCSLPGTYPFYFNELQGTYFVEDQQLVYAVFSTAPTSVYASAVCVYNSTSFNNAFSGSYKYQANAEMAWTRVTNSRPNHQCPAETSPLSRMAGRKNQTPAQKHLVDAQKFQMMDDAVQPLSQEPVVVAENERFTHIAVHQIQTKHHEKFNVVFLVTLEGYIKKFITLPESKKACLVEEIRVVKGEEIHPVQSFQLDKDKGTLFLGMRNRIFQISVQRCDRFKTKIACLNAQDPYCGWHAKHRRCTSIPSNLPSTHWHQDITSCPLLTSPVDGDWSAWSDWEKCDHESSGGHCKCSRRLCTNPKPRHGGLDCRGIDVRVTNCTTHGGWTEWSDWSACSATCGMSSRSRRRSCTNPTPGHGGRVCVGPSLDTGFCMKKSCPEPRTEPQHGGWSEWSSWSDCDQNCDGGIRTRQRSCINPPPLFGGNDCSGNDEQWMRCNKHPCPQLRKATSWTSWSKSNVTSQGFNQERYRFVCKAPVADVDDIDVIVRHDKQYCDGSTCGAQEPGHESSSGQWSKWSSWTQCDRICDGGQQYRERICEGGEGEWRQCIGHGREVRLCNQQSCEGEWSCWGEFSQCSVTCGVGLKWRRRNCVSSKPGGHYSIPCTGRDYDESQCIMAACVNSDTSSSAAASSNSAYGWDQWSEWSPCTAEGNNLQQRHRSCLLSPFPGSDQCRGSTVEARPCSHNNLISAFSGEVKMASDQHCIEVYLLVIVGIIGFILGGIICVGVYFFFHRRQLEMQEQRFETLPRCNVKQNVYMRPEDARSDLSMTINKFDTLSKVKNNNQSLTVEEATLKRNQILRTNSMRTNLTLVDNEYT